MNAKTLKALKGSIRKWQRIVNGTGEDHGPDNCPLCKQFWHYDDYTDIISCGGCPVATHTGQYGCKDTPYDDFQEKATKSNATKELNFLKSLLPKK